MQNDAAALAHGCKCEPDSSVADQPDTSARAQDAACDPATSEDSPVIDLTGAAYPLDEETEDDDITVPQGPRRSRRLTARFYS